MPLFFLHRRSSYPGAPSSGGSSLLGSSLLCLLFGLAILAAPDLLAYFIASFLILIGLMLFGMWWRIRR